jgi:hypothetical protein
MEHRTSSLGSLPETLESTHILPVNDGNDSDSNFNRIVPNKIDQSSSTKDNAAAGAGGGGAYYVTLIARYGKQRKITLERLDAASTTIGHVKEMLHRETNILPKRQKLVGLAAKSIGSSADGTGSNHGRGVVHDALPLCDLKELAKGSKAKSAASAAAAAATSEGETVATIIVHQFILMGTPEEEIFVDPGLRDDLPDIVDDFELDFNAGSTEWLQHRANGENLKKFTERTAVHVMNAPRPGKPLLVLDLDHTLLDFRCVQSWVRLPPPHFYLWIDVGAVKALVLFNWCCAVLHWSYSVQLPLSLREYDRRRVIYLLSLTNYRPCFLVAFFLYLCLPAKQIVPKRSNSTTQPDSPVKGWLPS